MRTAQHVYRSVLCLVAALSLLWGPPAAAQAKKLNVWVGWSLLLPVFEEAARDFEAENPGVEVEVLAYELREFERKLAVSLPTGTGPDIFVTSEYIIPMYIEAGLVADPPPHVERFIREAFDPLTVSLNTFGGKVYGVPQVGIARVLYWNRKMFREAGLEGPPQTWDELVDAARKLTVYGPDGRIERSGISLRKFGGGSGVTEKWQIFLAGTGAKIVEQTPDGKWRAGYDNDGGYDTLKLYIDLIHKYRTDGFDIKQDSEAFALEDTAMFIREFWPIPYFREVAPHLEYGTALIPAHPNGRGTVYSTESAFVSKGSKEQELAWQFIMHFNQEKYVKKWFREEGWPAPRIDLDFSDIYEEEPAFQIANVRPEGYIYSTYPPLAVADEIWTKLGERLERAFRDSSLVDNPEGIRRTIKEAADETNAILAEAGLLGR